MEIIGTHYDTLNNQPLEKWDVSQVTNMPWMFFRAESFNQPLEKWDVSQVIKITGMFSRAESFNQPLEKWDGKLFEAIFKLHFC